MVASWENELFALWDARLRDREAAYTSVTHLLCCVLKCGILPARLRREVKFICVHTTANIFDVKSVVHEVESLLQARKDLADSTSEHFTGRPVPKVKRRREGSW